MATNWWDAFFSLQLASGNSYPATKFNGVQYYPAFTTSATPKPATLTANRASWQPNTIQAIGNTIIDSNGNTQTVWTLKSPRKWTGASTPSWAIVVGQTTVDQDVTWICTKIGS